MKKCEKVDEVVSSLIFFILYEKEPLFVADFFELIHLHAPCIYPNKYIRNISPYILEYIISTSVIKLMQYFISSQHH